MKSSINQNLPRINLSKTAVIKVMVETIIMNDPNFPTFPSESLAMYPVTNPIAANMITIVEMIVEPEIRLRATIPGKPTRAINPTVRQPFAWMKSKSTEKNLSRK